MVRLIFTVLRIVLYWQGVWRRSVKQFREYYETLTFQKLLKVILGLATAILTILDKLVGMDVGVVSVIVPLALAVFAFMG